MSEDLWIDGSGDPLDEAAPPIRRRRIPRIIEPFAGVGLSEIRNRENDEVLPPVTRLWLLVKIRTGEGRRPFRLTNDEAGEIGLTRWQKYALLKRLEEERCVAVQRSIGRSPLVSLVKGRT